MYFATGENARKMDRSIMKVLNCIATSVSGKRKLHSEAYFIPYPLSNILTLEALLDPFSYGLHRILVEIKPRDSFSRQIKNISQTDILRLLNDHRNLVHLDIFNSNLKKLDAVTRNIVTCKSTDPVFDAFKKINGMYLSALAVVNPDTGSLVATLSASDLRFIHSDTLFDMTKMTVLEFLSDSRSKIRKPLTIDEHSEGLFDAIDRMLKAGVHRLWVVDDFKVPFGVVTMSDIFRVLSGRTHQQNNSLQDNAKPFISQNKLRKWTQPKEELGSDENDDNDFRKNDMNWKQKNQENDVNSSQTQSEITSQAEP